MMLGSKVRSSQGRTTVIGAVESSPVGNVVLRIGRMSWDGEYWEATNHVVLTPEERDTLIEVLKKPETN